MDLYPKNAPVDISLSKKLKNDLVIGDSTELRCRSEMKYIGFIP